MHNEIKVRYIRDNEEGRKEGLYILIRVVSYSIKWQYMQAGNGIRLS
jgi:hypothetical protein